VTGIVALAVLLPVGIMLGDHARERAIAEARRMAAVAIAALTATSDPALLEAAIAAGTGVRADRVAVHGLGTGPIGVARASAGQIEETEAEGRVVPVADGVSYLVRFELPGAAASADGGSAVVEVFVPAAELADGVTAARWTLVAIGLLLLTLSVLAGDRLAARSARAARDLAAGARSFGDGAFDIRVDHTGPRELAEAGLAFNSMAAKVSKRRAAERELIADLSHRLRTPLTALRLEAERDRSTGAAGYRLTDAVEAMEREVDHLINTARQPYEESPEAEPDHCDAGEVVRERMAFWTAVAEDQSRPFRVYGAERPAPVPLPASELAAALDALLGNVFRYTPQGTAFEVALSRRDGYVAVRVDDAGPGIPSRDRAIRRGTSGRGSTGLGLDIVRRAAVAARGGVDIDRSGLGGTSVVMLLADADPAPTAARQLRGFVGRLKREPDERRWGRRAKAARAHS
jgi:signal transduction histidine kinase